MHIRQLSAFFTLLLCLTQTLYAKEVSSVLPVVQVSNSVYSIISPYYGLPTEENQGWNSNSHFVVTGDGVLVIDSGSSEKIGNAIIETIKGITEQPVRWLVNTHSHADHWLGNAAFAKSGVEIIASQSASAEMQAYGEEDVKAFNRMTKGATGDSKVVLPTTQLSNTQTRTLGQLKVELHFANNGHSPGDMLLWIPEEKVIIGGDVFSSDWMPIMTYHGNLPDLLNTLKMAVELAPEKVLTGHGSVTDIKDLQRDLQFLTQVQSEIQHAQKSKLSVKKMSALLTEKLAPDYREQYQDFDSSIQYLLETIYKKQANTSP